MFSRFLRTDGLNGGLAQRSVAGDGIAANINESVIAADANATLSINDIAGGAVQFTGFTAGRNITTPTAAQILAAAPDMNIGDSFALLISTVAAFAGTFVANTGVTLAGRSTVPASSFSIVIVKRTGAAAFTWRVL